LQPGPADAPGRRPVTDDRDRIPTVIEWILLAVMLLTAIL
jgi:hypothetical protein